MTTYKTFNRMSGKYIFLVIVQLVMSQNKITIVKQNLYEKIKSIQPIQVVVSFAYSSKNIYSSIFSLSFDIPELVKRLIHTIKINKIEK